MLGFSFFISIFSTLSWFIYCAAYIMDKLHGVELSSLGAIDLLIYLTIAILPVISIWLIFGHINSYSNNRTSSKKMQYLFDQMKRNQDYSDLIARILIECEQNLRSGFILNRFDIFISEVNELISEIIGRSKLVSDQQLQDAWATAQNGERWGLSKIIIDLNGKNTVFSSDVLEVAREDGIMAGAILEFCARYQKLLTVLEKHDKEKIFLDIVETGVLGKVFSIFAPMAETIKKEKRAIEGADIDADDLYEEELLIEKPGKKGFFARMFGRGNKDEKIENKEEPTIEKDSFSKMLDETNFEPIENKAKDFNIDINEENPVSEPQKTEVPAASPAAEEFRPFSKTEQAMANLRQDWDEIKKYDRPAPSFERPDNTGKGTPDE